MVVHILPYRHRPLLYIHCAINNGVVPKMPDDLPANVTLEFIARQLQRVLYEHEIMQTNLTEMKRMMRESEDRITHRLSQIERGIDPISNLALRIIGGFESRLAKLETERP
jgi:hypothetical protein